MSASPLQDYEIRRNLPTFQAGIVRRLPNINLISQLRDEKPTEELEGRAKILVDPFKNVPFLSYWLIVHGNFLGVRRLLSPAATYSL